MSAWPPGRPFSRTVRVVKYREAAAASTGVGDLKYLERPKMDFLIVISIRENDPSETGSVANYKDDLVNSKNPRVAPAYTLSYTHIVPLRTHIHICHLSAYLFAYIYTRIGAFTCSNLCVHAYTFAQLSNITDYTQT